MSDTEAIDDETCLCQTFVPAEKRIDFLEIREDKNGKRAWRTVLRYHQDCPEHGIVVLEPVPSEPTQAPAK